MKVIDILIMRSKNENMPKEIIVKGKIRHYKFKKENDINYIDNEGDYLFSCEYNWFGMLNDEIEIIEEPKEELEEIELIDIHYINGKCIFKVDGKQIDETIALKVNELIENQNKIIRELKDNKGNE